MGYNGRDNIISIPFELNKKVVTSINNAVFENMSFLESIFIPDTVVSIGEDAFKNCTKLKSVYYSGSNDGWNDIGIHSGNIILDEINLVCNCTIAIDWYNSVYEYDSAKLNLGFQFDLLNSDGVICVEIYDFDESTANNDVTDMILNKAYAYNISKEEMASEGLYFKREIPFVPDDKEHLLKIYFWNNANDKNVIGQELSTHFWAENEPIYSNGFYYLPIDENTAKIVGYRNGYRECFIPPTIDGYTITKVSNSAFEYAEFDTILIPDTITEIGGNAFYGCNYIDTINYIGTEEQWNAITIGENNDALLNANKVFNYGEDVVYGRFGEVVYTGSAVEGTLEFNYVYKNCVAIIEIRNHHDNIEETLEVEIPVGTEQREFSIPFVAYDEDYEIYVFFVNNTTEKIEIGEECFDYFYVERECFTEGDYTYAILNGKAVIVSYNGTETELEVPVVLGEYPVIGIADDAFEECERNGVYITSLTLPSCIEKISDFALDYLYALKAVNVSEESEHFCVVDNVLFDKDKTKLIKYPARKIGSQYHIPNTVKVISSIAFADNEYLREITIPDSVTNINEYAFAGSTIQTITIPASVNDIESGAFNYCYDLNEINVDKDNTNYTSEYGVLYNKDKTSIIQYPIGSESSTFVIPNGIVTICKFAFFGSNISSLVLPASLSHIEYNAFYRCENLNKVLYYGSREDWQNVECDRCDNIFDGVEFIYDYTPTGIFPYLTSKSYIHELLTLNLSFVCNDTDSIAIVNIYDEKGNIQKTLNQTVSAGTEKFAIDVPFEIDNMEHYIEIMFVDNITDTTELCDPIKAYFYAERERFVDGEWEYVITDGKAYIVNYLGDSTEVEIPAILDNYTVVGLGDGVFAENRHKNTRVTKLILPNSIETISDFALDCLYSLTSINISDENTHFSVIDGILFNKDKTTLIKYPSSKAGTSYTIPNTVKVISTIALADNENLKAIILPDGITDIQEYAFAGSAIKNITIPGSVINIETDAFSRCADLADICVDVNNTEFASINGVLFSKDKTTLLLYPCGNINTAYRIPDGVKIIAIESMNNEYLEKIEFPKSICIIEELAFGGCISLNDVIYPGTDDEYLKIDIHPGNSALTNSSITFGYNDMPANIKSIRCWYDNNNITAKIKFNHLEQAGTLYLAIYDEGKLVALHDKPLTIDDTENTIEIIDVDETYKNYDVKVFYWNDSFSLKPLANSVEAEIVEAILVDAVLESEHPYENSIDETKTYVYNGECVSIDVTFSDDTITESGFDYIYIYDSNDNKIGQYSGTELAGQTITVPGNTVKIRLTSDGSVTANGYKTENIVVNK